MNRREFIIQMGTALIAAPMALSLESCGNDNGGDVAPPTGFDEISTTEVGHSHSVRIVNSDLANPPAGGVVYTTSLSAGHSHTITLTQQQLTDINNGGLATVVSSLNDGHTHDWTIQKS